MLSFYESWYYLEEHPIFNGKFQNLLDIEVVKVNPKTKKIEDNVELNTLTQIWLEIGPCIKNGYSHDYDLDCGGDSFEEAIVNLAELVKKIYTEDINIIKKRITDKYGQEELII